MSENDDWSPDEDLGTETFEQGDEALEDESIEEVLQDPSLEPALRIDDLELAEAGVTLDDPESMAVLDGGIDDPDGTGPRTGLRRGADDDGWDLAAPLAADDADEDDPTV
jgi:hypothetical protein